MMNGDQRILLAYYGDDFTGSTDALESLSDAGARTALFLQPPSPLQFHKYGHLDAVGVAGTTRSMNPGEMDLALRPAFEAFKLLNPRHVHYKVCSTFDSSPERGSIGKAIDIGAEVFNAELIPLLVGAPDLGRYCVFGNLFARMGIGTAGSIYRLDRHPSMSKHPVTPSDESDLLIHLGKQTRKKTALFDILDLELSFQTALHKLRELNRSGSEVILFDALYEHQMPRIGRLIDSFPTREKPLFSVGSSGIGKALAAHWAQQGVLPGKAGWPTPGEKAPLLVVSGSCSPVTAGQISWAISQGFAEIPVEPKALTTNSDFIAYTQTCSGEVIAYLREGRSVIVHTCLGPGDRRFSETNELLSQKKSEGSPAAIFGKLLGQVIRKSLEEIRVGRVVIAGGDVSGYTAAELGIEAIEMIAPAVKGAPLCRVYAPDSPVDGIQINFKGGQVGGERYFETILKGTAE